MSEETNHPTQNRMLVQKVWYEVGVALALLGEADASPKARSLIRDALESATGCKAPHNLGGSVGAAPGSKTSASVEGEWWPMASAPKDGTMLRLLVVPDQEEFTAFDDSLTPYETIGSNNLSDTQEDRWEFAGWDWQQDCFINGRGEVIGWTAFKAAVPSHFEEAIRWCLARDERNGSLPEAYSEKLRAATEGSTDG